MHQHESTEVKRRLFDTLNLVLDVHVHLSELLELLGFRLPVPSAVGLEESGDQLAERVGVGIKQALGTQRKKARSVNTVGTALPAE